MVLVVFFYKKIQKNEINIFGKKRMISLMKREGEGESIGTMVGWFSIKFNILTVRRKLSWSVSSSPSLLVALKAKVWYSKDVNKNPI